MRLKTLYIPIGIALALIISACDVSVTLNPPLPNPDYSFTAGSDEDEGWVIDIPARSSVLVKVSVPTGPNLVFFELGSELGLEVLNSARIAVASSSSAAFFAPGSAGLGAAAIEPQAILAAFACRGSCVIVDRETSFEGTFYARVSNDSTSAVSTRFFAYRDAFADEFEPLNNNPTTTEAVLNVTEGNSGALETLGDRDYWRVVGTGSVTLRAQSPAVIDVAMYVIDLAGAEWGPYRNGSDVALEHGEIVYVQAEDDRAGSSDSGAYFFDPN